ALNWWRKHPQREHIKCDVPDSRGVMQEQRGEQLPPLEVAGIEFTPLHELLEVEGPELLANQSRQIHRQIRHDQRLGHDRPAFGIPVCAEGNEHGSNTETQKRRNAKMREYLPQVKPVDAQSLLNSRFWLVDRCRMDLA